MRDTIDMAREAGIDPTYTPGMIPMFKAFEALVRADEREACAKICDEFFYGSTKILIERAIRNRGNT